MRIRNGDFNVELKKHTRPEWTQRKRRPDLRRPSKGEHRIQRCRSICHQYPVLATDKWPEIKKG